MCHSQWQWQYNKVFLHHISCTKSFQTSVCYCYKFTAFFLRNTVRNVAFETRKAFTLLKNSRSINIVSCVLFPYLEYKGEVLALPLYLKSIGMPSSQLCWSYLLLRREKITIVVVRIIKIQTFKQGMLHLMKFHFIQIKIKFPD